MAVAGGLEELLGSGKLGVPDELAERLRPYFALASVPLSREEPDSGAFIQAGRRGFGDYARSFFKNWCREQGEDPAAHLHELLAVGVLCQLVVCTFDRPEHPYSSFTDAPASMCFQISRNMHWRYAFEGVPWTAADAAVLLDLAFLDGAGTDRRKGFDLEARIRLARTVTEMVAAASGPPPELTAAVRRALDVAERLDWDQGSDFERVVWSWLRTVESPQVTHADRALHALPAQERALLAGHRGRVTLALTAWEKAVAPSTVPMVAAISIAAAGRASQMLKPLPKDVAVSAGVLAHVCMALRDTVPLPRNDEYGPRFDLENVCSYIGMRRPALPPEEVALLLDLVTRRVRRVPAGEWADVDSKQLAVALVAAERLDPVPFNVAAAVAGLLTAMIATGDLNALAQRRRLWALLPPGQRAATVEAVVPRGDLWSSRVLPKLARARPAAVDLLGRLAACGDRKPSAKWERRTAEILAVPDGARLIRTLLAPIPAIPDHPKRELLSRPNQALVQAACLTAAKVDAPWAVTVLEDAAARLGVSEAGPRRPRSRKLALACVRALGRRDDLEAAAALVRLEGKLLFKPLADAIASGLADIAVRAGTTAEQFREKAAGC